MRVELLQLLAAGIMAMARLVVTRIYWSWGGGWTLAGGRPGENRGSTLAAAPTQAAEGAMGCPRCGFTPEGGECGLSLILRAQSSRLPGT